MEFPRMFSEIIDIIRTDYQLCNGALRAMAAERRSASSHDGSSVLYAIAKFEATLRGLTETCNHAAQRINDIAQQIRAADAASTAVDADAVLSTAVGSKSAELTKYLDAQHATDDGYIGADYRHYMDAIQAVWIEYEIAGWHCTEATDLAIKNFHQQHQVIVSILQKGVKDAIREMYQSSLQHTVEMLPVAYFLENMEAPPLRADADITHANEDCGATVKEELNRAD